MDYTTKDEEEKNNVCPICDRRFDKLSGLRQHVTKSHTVDEINAIIEENSQRSQRSPQPPPPPRPNDSKLQIVKEEPNSSPEKSIYQFDIVENDGAGNCLFLAILEYLRGHSHLFPDTPNDVHQLRTATVNHIVLPIDQLNQSNFERFKDNLMVNLNNHIPTVINGTATSDEWWKTEYAKYMSSPGIYGTTAELCAMSELFNFSFYVVRKYNDGEYSCYDYGSMEKFENHRTNAVVFLFFTGSPDRGHFRLMVTDKSSPLPILPVGAYKRIAEYTTSRLTSICPSTSYPNLTDEHNRNNETGRQAEEEHCEASTASAPTLSNQTQVDPDNFDRMKELLVFIQTLRAHTSILKRIPKAARIQTAIEFSNLIDTCIHPRATFPAWGTLVHVLLHRLQIA